MSVHLLSNFGGPVFESCHISLSAHGTLREEPGSLNVFHTLNIVVSKSEGPNLDPKIESLLHRGPKKAPKGPMNLAHLHLSPVGLND